MTLQSWETVRLQNYCSKIGSGATPRGGESVYIDRGVALIRSQNVYNGLFEGSGLAYLNEDHAEQLKGVTVEENDILLNITGDSVARCCQVPDSILPARVNQHVAIIRPRPKSFNQRFLSYFFISPFMQATMLSLAGSGGTRNALTKEMIEQFEVPKPPLTIQKKIASILSNYDDLIENNRRRMVLLEEAARQLYREWFIRLKFPGHEHTRIIDGVPEGWEKGMVSDFYETSSGGTPIRKNPEFYDGDIKWVKTQELQDGFLFDTEEHITEDAIKKSAAKLFPTNTLLIAMYGATIGKVGVIVEPSTCNQACCAVMPKAEATSYEHAFLFFLNNKDGLRNLGQGAAQKNISQQVIRA